MTVLPSLRQRLLEVAYRSGEPQHIPSSLGVLPIIWALYDRVMDVTADNWREPGRDVFILSKGHAALALYVVLEAKRFISSDDLRICKPGSILGGHPTCDIPGVWASTGSLGHGLPIAAGLAHAKKLKGEPGKVYCLTSDGEMEEGSCWEALRLARKLGLSNLYVLVDENGTHHGSQLWGRLTASGVNTDVLLSTDPADIAHRLGWPNRDLPQGTIIRTVKGQGIKAMEAEPAAWHRRLPTPQEYRDMLEAM